VESFESALTSYCAEFKRTRTLDARDAGAIDASSARDAGRCGGTEEQ
jgi:hypothetical protein